MSKEKHDENAPVPKGQTVFDKMWLLFVVSLAISGIIYNLWGIIELLNVPPAP